MLSLTTTKTIPVKIPELDTFVHIRISALSAPKVARLLALVQSASDEVTEQTGDMIESIVSTCAPAILSVRDEGGSDVEFAEFECSWVDATTEQRREIAATWYNILIAPVLSDFFSGLTGEKMGE